MIVVKIFMTLGAIAGIVTVLFIAMALFASWFYRPKQPNRKPIYKAQ